MEIDGLTIWQAARAASAAPTFFQRLKIGTDEFIDGGMGFNNPSKALMRETQRIFGREPTRTVACIISVGTGMPKSVNLSELRGVGLTWIKDLAKALSDMATNCEETNEELMAFSKKLPNFYFRFNVEQGLQDVRMDRYEDLNVVKANTQRYLMKATQQEKLHQAAKTLLYEGPGICPVSALGN